jgi:hypothetical protein
MGYTGTDARTALQSTGSVSGALAWLKDHEPDMGATQSHVSGQVGVIALRVRGSVLCCPAPCCESAVCTRAEGLAL